MSLIKTSFLFLAFLISFSHAVPHHHARAHKQKGPKSTQPFNPTGKTNVALYWGQGAGQQRLVHYCNQTAVDIIPLAFMHVFPAQGNGYPGDNFGNQCWGTVYAGPGNKPSLNQLQSQCPQLVADIPVCQSTYGKKIILSLGGATNSYQLTGATEGIAFANFLWGAFGPQNASWIASGLPRPFDGPNNLAVEVDGFDFDIEWAPTDSSAGYIAMVKQLRTLFSGASKPYLITGAPQCVVPDANMGVMIAKAQFDIIWVQYYNTPQCSARNWVTANPKYASTHVELPSGFSYNTWTNFLVGTASANAKLYIGVPGGPTTDTNFLNPAEISNLAAAYFCKPNFGGIMIWEATVAESNPTGPYYATVKNVLNGLQNKACSSSSVSISTTIFPKTSTRSIMSTSTSVKSSSSTSMSRKTSTISSSRQTTTTKATSTVSSKLSSSSTPSSSAPKASTTSKKTSSSLLTSKKTSSISTRSTSPIKILTTSAKSTPPSSIKTTSSTKKTGVASPSPSIVIPAGACGPQYGNSCLPGYCCSAYGFCGNTAGYCGTGCQSAFGVCT